MLAQTSELERIMRQLIETHRSLIGAMESHQTAMKAMDPKAMERAGQDQQSLRRRILLLERQRIAATAARGRQLRLDQPVTLTMLAQADPQRGQVLMKLRQELKSLVEEAARRSQIASRLAGAVLGHLNTALRFVGGAMSQAGVYTRGGSPRMAGRIGVIEAVG